MDGLYGGKSHLEMDDDSGVALWPRKPPYINHGYQLSDLLIHPISIY